MPWHPDSSTNLYLCKDSSTLVLLSRTISSKDNMSHRNHILRHHPYMTFLWVSSSVLRQDSSTPYRHILQLHIRHESTEPQCETHQLPLRSKVQTERYQPNSSPWDKPPVFPWNNTCESFRSDPPCHIVQCTCVRNVR